MNRILLVGLGGFVGSVLRYTAGAWVGRLKGGSGFPLETLAVNALGCLAIGALAAFAETRGAFSDGVRAMLFVGLLGGFTTFSTFGYETLQLLRGGQIGSAALSVALQLGLGLFAVWAGYALVSRS